MLFNAYILIPIVGNDGVPFDEFRIAVWDDYLSATFGGFSTLPDSVRGAWMDGDFATTTTPSSTASP